MSSVIMKKKFKYTKQVPYASIVISLLYVQVCTHFVVGVLERHLSYLGQRYKIAIQKIVEYLKGAQSFMLTYYKSNNLIVVGYFNSNLVSYLDDRKSTSDTPS